MGKMTNNETMAQFGDLIGVVHWIITCDKQMQI